MASADGGPATRQAEAKSSGGSAGSAGAPVPRHAGTVGKGGGWLKKMRLLRGWKGERRVKRGRAKNQKIRPGGI
jgi:hypothetical protein